MSEQYYVLLGEEAVGPLSKEELFSTQNDRCVTGNTLICRVGDSEWKPMDEVIPSIESVRPAPPPPPVASKRSQRDRELLREYLATIFHPQVETASTDEPPSIKDALADAIPLLGNILGRRKAVVAGTTVSDSQTENTKREALFQQQRLLTLSATYMESAPWISYLTAAKHPRFMECYGLTTSAFADFGDKKLVDETARLADDLEVKSCALMDSETSRNVRALLSFQDVKEVVASAASILNEIIRSPHRELIHCELTGGKVEIAQNYPTLQSLPDGEVYQNLFYLITILGGSAVAGAAILVEEKTDTLRWALAFGTVIGIVFAAVCYIKADTQRTALMAEKRRYEYQFSCEQRRVQNILDVVNGLAGMFRSTVKPLLHTQKIPVNLNDFEGMLSELVTFQTWGLETESHYTKT